MSICGINLCEFVAICFKIKTFLEVFCHFCYLSVDLIDEFLDGLYTLFTTTLLTDGYCTVSSFLFADDHHIGDTLQLVVADLTT